MVSVDQAYMVGHMKMPMEVSTTKCSAVSSM